MGAENDPNKALPSWQQQRHTSEVPAVSGQADEASPNTISRAKLLEQARKFLDDDNIAARAVIGIRLADDRGLDLVVIDQPRV